MPDLLAAIASLFRGSQVPPAATLAAALEDVSRAITGTEHAITETEAAHAAAIFNAGDWAKTRDTLAVLTDELARLHLAEGSLRERHAQAVAAEAAAARAAEREKAIARRDAARKSLAGYPALAEKLIRIIAEIADADSAVDAYNLGLAPGEEPLGRTEEPRDNPGNRREIVSETVVSAWAPAGGTDPVDAATAAEIIELPDGSGVRHLGVDHSGLHRKAFFDKRRFSRRVVKLSRPYSMAERLSTVVLPGFEAGSPPLFRAPSEASPREVLSIIRDRRAWHPEEDDGTTFEYIPLSVSLADAAE